MAALFKRHSNAQCFFCLSPVPISTAVRDFKCPSCTCWNRFDKNGKIISDEPAMHEEELNKRSFSKRASHSNDRLPSMYGPGPFCHSCLANQRLITQILSEYLPDPSHPKYEHLVQGLPTYQESLYARLPPVCEQCLPQVEEEIEKKDQMARTKALDGWLSKGNRRRRVSETNDSRLRILPKEICWWRVRGCLFVASYIISIGGNLGAVYDYHPFKWLSFSRPILPLLALLSLLWSAWNPAYHSILKAQIQGRDIRVQGKKAYNTVQMLTWTTRLITSIILFIRWFKPNLDVLHRDSFSTIYFLSAFFVDFIAIVVSCSVLRIRHPPAIRLIDTHSHKFDKSRSGTPLPDSLRMARPQTLTITEHDLYLSRALASNPIAPRLNPVFGKPSLPGVAPRTPPRALPDPDDMDWTPTYPDGMASSSNSNGQKRLNAEDDGWLRPQRFFAPEKPTGLEGLFYESARIRDDELMPLQSDVTAFDVIQPPTRMHQLFNHLWKWGALYILSIALLIATAMNASRLTSLMQSVF